MIFSFINGGIVSWSLGNAPLDQAMPAYLMLEVNFGGMQNLSLCSHHLKFKMCLE